MFHISHSGRSWFIQVDDGIEINATLRGNWVAWCGQRKDQRHRIRHEDDATKVANGDVGRRSGKPRGDGHIAHLTGVQHVAPGGGEFRGENVPRVEPRHRPIGVVRQRRHGSRRQHEVLRHLRRERRTIGGDDGKCPPQFNKWMN